MAKYAKLAIDEYAQASTLAEEIISSVRTAQAFGAQTKLAQLYDNNLVAAQKAGYKQQLAGATMLSCIFGLVYSFYGLGFCMSPQEGGETDCRGRISHDCLGGLECRDGAYCCVGCYGGGLFSGFSCPEDRDFC